MRIFLVGYMYSGKSTVGRRLAKRMGYTFYDTDDLFESHYHIGVADFFRRYDAEAFRKLEHEILLSTALNDNSVISTGGGTPCFHNNMEFIKNNGVSIYLEASLNTILSRKAKSKKARPLLNDLHSTELADFIQNQMDERRPFYEKADFRFNAENIDIDTICKALQDFQCQKP